MPLSGHKYQYRKQSALPGDWSVQIFSPGGGPLIVRYLVRGLLHNKLFLLLFIIPDSRHVSQNAISPLPLDQATHVFLQRS